VAVFNVVPSEGDDDATFLFLGHVKKLYLKLYSGTTERLSEYDHMILSSLHAIEPIASLPFGKDVT